VLEKCILVLTMLPLKFGAFIDMQHIVQIVDMEGELRSEEGDEVGIVFERVSVRGGEGNDGVRLLPKVSVFGVVLVQDAHVDEVGGCAFVSERRGQG